MDGGLLKPCAFVVSGLYRFQAFLEFGLLASQVGNDPRKVPVLPLPRQAPIGRRLSTIFVEATYGQVANTMVLPFTELRCVGLGWKTCYKYYMKTNERHYNNPKPQPNPRKFRKIVVGRYIYIIILYTWYI